MLRCSLHTCEEMCGRVRKGPFRLRKPFVYPLNYGDKVVGGGVDSFGAVLSSIVKVAPVPIPLLDA